MRSRAIRLLRSRMLEEGIAPVRANRLAMELRDHLEDLTREAESAGLHKDQALAEAERRLGEVSMIEQGLLDRTEFKTWPYRYPRVARLCLPVAYAILLPATPIFAGMANPSLVARWTAALMLSTAVTASMLLCMQLAIVLT